MVFVWIFPNVKSLNTIFEGFEINDYPLNSLPITIYGLTMFYLCFSIAFYIYFFSNTVSSLKLIWDLVFYYVSFYDYASSDSEPEKSSDIIKNNWWNF